MTDQLQLQIDERDEVRPLWERALLSAGRRLGGDIVESWLREAEPVSLRDGVLVLGAPNGTARDWIDKKYSAAIAESFQEVNGQDVRVQVVVRPRAEEPSVRREPAPEIVAP